MHEKDESEIKSVKQIYGIDLHDRSIFDMVIKTDRLSAETCSEIICTAAMAISKADQSK